MAATHPPSARPFGTRGASRFEGRLLAGALAILGLYLAPLVVLGQDAYVLIHDNLDANVLWYKILASSGLIFAPNDAIVPNLLGGLPRSAFGSELNLQLWLYVAFEPLTAYVVNQVLLRLAALFGMFLLLRSHVLTAGDRWTAVLRVGCALCFCLLPFWPSGGLSVAGQPLALHAFLNIRRGSRGVGNWAVIALLPFYSYLVVASVFFVIALGLFAVGDAVRARRVDAPFLAAIGLHGLLLFGVEYRLLVSTASGGSFVSHRTEFAPLLVGASRALRFCTRMLLRGQYHAASVHTPVITTSVLAAIALRWRERGGLRPLLACVLAACGIAAFYGLWHWQGFSSAREALSLGVGFNADRFYMLLPLLWGVAFALSLRMVSRGRILGRPLAGGLLGLQIAFLFLQSDFVAERQNHGISYRAFFASEQFAAIDREIGLPKQSYRVVSLGLHPSIAQYNGFLTADGYFPNYPLRHKHALRDVIRRELEKDPALARYFDDWGSRAYVFSSELGRDFLQTALDPRVIRDLELDRGAMESLGIRFVVSAAEIAEPARSGLAHRRTFVHPDSAWTIHLYELAETRPAHARRIGTRDGNSPVNRRDPAADTSHQRPACAGEECDSP